MKNQHTEEIRRQQSAFALEQIRASMGATLEQFYRRLAHLFIDHPDALTVSVELVGERLTFTARPHPADAGKLIGAKGAMYHSFLTLMRALAARHSIQIHFSLATEKGSPQSGLPKFVPDPRWPRAKLEGVFNATCADLLEFPFKLDSFDSTDNKTHYRLAIDSNEVAVVSDAELKDALTKVWHACGRAHGRFLFLEALERGTK